MYRRQLLLVVLLGGVAYLWWQSRLPSHYSEWAEHLVSDATWSDEPFTGPDVLTWSYDSPGDSSWRVASAEDSLRHYRVQLVHADSMLWQVHVALTPGGDCLRLTLRASGKLIQVEPRGDSARFTSAGEQFTQSWIAWSPGAVLYESIPALCDSWGASDAERPATLVRIQPQTEVVDQLPGVLRPSADGGLELWAAGKQLVRIEYAAGSASRIFLAGGRCLTRRAPPAS